MSLSDMTAVMDSKVPPGPKLVLLAMTGIGGSSFPIPQLERATSLSFVVFTKHLIWLEERCFLTFGYYEAENRLVDVVINMDRLATYKPFGRSK